MDRREFLASAAAIAIPPPPAGKMIGIQVGAVSFVDEGIEPVLDAFQKNHINTLFLAVFTYGRGIAGRQVPGQPLPDHGKQEYDEKTFHGGNYAAPHPQYYKDTVIPPLHAPDLGDFDVLAAVLPADRKSTRLNSSHIQKSRMPSSA